MKPAAQLSPLDFVTHRVWEFANDMELETPDETYMRPMTQLPVDTLANRLVGVQLTLANGQTRFGILGNIDLTNPASTEHFLTVKVFRPSGEGFDLARYHDFDHSQRDSTALGVFLGLSLQSLFPMSYDISDVAVGHPDCLRRNIPTAPSSRLSMQELIELSLR